MAFKSIVTSFCIKSAEFVDMYGDIKTMPTDGNHPDPNDIQQECTTNQGASQCDIQINHNLILADTLSS